MSRYDDLRRMREERFARARVTKPPPASVTKPVTKPATNPRGGPENAANKPPSFVHDPHLRPQQPRLERQHTEIQPARACAHRARWQMAKHVARATRKQPPVRHAQPHPRQRCRPCT